MTSENKVETADKKAELCEAHSNTDMKSRYILKEISNVRWFDPVKQEWIDVGYKGPISLDYESEVEV